MPPVRKWMAHSLGLLSSGGTGSMQLVCKAVKLACAPHTPQSCNVIANIGNVEMGSRLNI